MAKKTKKLNEIKVVFPEINQHYIPADPGNAFSRESFLPYKFKMQKSSGKGTFQLDHKINKIVPIGADAKVLFLYIPPYATCNCEKWVDGGDNQPVCYSPDNRGYSNRGFNCAKCQVNRDDGFSRRLTKDAYFLVMDPDEENLCYLSKYTGRLDNVKDLIQIQNQVHLEMHAQYGAVGSQALIEIYPTMVKKGAYQVLQFDAKYKIAGVMDDASYKEWAEYSKQIQQIVDNAKDKSISRHIDRYKEKVSEAEVLGVDADELIARELESIKGSPLVARGIAPQPEPEQPVQTTIEAPVNEAPVDAPVVEDDDDLPF